ncbi:MAG: GTP-binding protein [Myxococcota bacterium]
MAEVNPDTGAVNARILYWGPEGSGKSTNLRVIHAKLRPDRRGELREVGTPLDPTVSYEVLPIELGDMGGVRTRIQVFAVPGEPSQSPTRKQLLDRVDGIVFVADAQRDRLDQNVASFEELRSSLAAYGRPLEQVPVVVQYNKCDLSDPYTLEELHRKLGTSGSAAFEATAPQGTAVLPTLTTISKRVVRSLREIAAEAAAAAPVSEPAAAAPAAPIPSPAAAAAEALPLETLAPEPELEVLSMDTQPGDLVEAIAIVDEHPDAELAGLASAGTEALFEPPAELLAGDPGDEEIDATDFVSFGAQVEVDGSLSVESVGSPERLSGQEVRIPLVLRDASGTNHQVSITLSFAAPERDA